MLKNKIYTVTPNPALDLSGTVKNLKPNEKSYVHGEQRSPGGNAINVARLLTRLGTPTLATGFLGGSTGEEIKSLLNKEQVRHHFVTVENSTRINITISNESDHQQTRLSFPGPIIKKSEKQKLFQFIKQRRDISLLVLGGSLPRGFSSDDVSQFMNLVKEKESDSIIDCPGEILSQILSKKPLLIKPNLDEFQVLVKADVKSIPAVIKKSQKLLKSIRFICVSSVEGGALLITQDGAYFGKIPKIKVRSSVGAGDSMVAAMAAQLHHKFFSPDQVLRWGLAAAAATLSESGTTLGSAVEISRLYKKTFVEKIRGHFGRSGEV